MSNVINMFSKKKVDTQDDRPSAPNSALEALGEYCGVLPAREGKVLKDMSEVLHAKWRIVNMAIADYEGFQQAYQEVCAESIEALNLPDHMVASEETNKVFYIGEGGHIWLINRDNLDKIAEMMKPASQVKQ